MRTLGSLADPTKHRDPIEIAGSDPTELRGYLRLMERIRRVERHLARMKQEGRIGGPVHLGVGQEAIAAGVTRWLQPTDYVFGGHRSHSHALSLGSSVHGLFAEVLGRDTGLSRGMGGSMHLWDGPRGFAGSVPIVGGTVPLAVGAGLSAKILGTGHIGVAYFGDGAIEEGAVQESLNLARMLESRVLFVVENNLFSSHMHIDLRQPSDSTARFAEANGVACEVVDGNDVLAVAAATGRLVSATRRGEGPGFLEVVTYRWYGHVDWREDIDVGVNRSAEVVAAWRARDPIGRLSRAMRNAGLWSDREQAALEAEIDAEIASAWERALSDPWPADSALLDRVYADEASRHADGAK